MGYTGEQKREYQRKWIAQRRADYMSGKVCVVCGATDNLEVDHINPDEKKYQVAALWGMSEKNENKIAELAKCQILCAAHHKEKTNVWWATRASHGRTLYAKGCKCEVCYKAQQQHNAQRNAS